MCPDVDEERVSLRDRSLPSRCVRGPRTIRDGLGGREVPRLADHALSSIAPLATPRDSHNEALAFAHVDAVALVRLAAHKSSNRAWYGHHGYGVLERSRLCCQRKQCQKTR